MQALHRFFPRPIQPWAVPLGLSTVLGLLLPGLAAAQLLWGPNGGGGSGTWTTNPLSPGYTNWYNGVGQTSWNDLVAVFGGSTGTVTIDAGGVNATGLTFNTNNYTISGSTLTLTGPGTFTASASGVTATVSAPVAGSVGLTKAGAGTLILSGSNTFTGAAVINAGVLRVGNPGALNAQAVRFGNGSTGTLRLFGTSTTISGLSTSATAAAVENGSGTATLTVDLTSSDTYAGILRNGAASTLRLTKSGAGTLTLSGANTYTGATTVSGGTLSINADSRLGSVPGSPTPGQLALNGGALSASATFTLHRNRSIAFGPSSGSGSGTIDVAPEATLTYGGGMTNNGGVGGLTKTGAGTLVLMGTSLNPAIHTYSGPTVISAGTLTLFDDITITATPTITVAAGATLHGLDVNGGFQLVSGQTLNGFGSVTATSGGSPSNLTAAVGATLAPGSATAVGTLTTTSLSFSRGSDALSPVGTYQVNIGGVSPTDSSSLSVTGVLNFASVADSKSRIRVVSLGNLPAVTTEYIIATVSGTGADILLEGAAADTASLNSGVAIAPANFAAGDSFSLKRTGNSLVLVYSPVPEPEAVALIFAAGFGLFEYLRRRRGRPKLKAL